MDPTLAELLADEVDLSALSDDDLALRREQLAAAILDTRENTDLTAEVLGLIQAGTTQVGEIAAEMDERAAIAADLVEQADAALASLDAIQNPVVEEVAAAEETAEGETAEGETPAETPAEGETPPAEVTAGATVPATPRRTINRNVSVPASHRPRPERPTGPAIIATGEVRGVAPGHQFDTLAEVDEAMFNKWLALRKSPDGHPHLMATIDYRDLYGAEQTLSGGDPWEMGEKITRYLDARRNGPDALRELRVASGGVPGPAEPRYGQITYGQADRPLRDALPGFLAARGEIVFNGSPTLADVVLDTALGAIGTVTSAADASGATKDIQEITAPTPTTVVVEAETMRWSQGNFADRFYPERTAAFMALGQVAFARHNDALRLADIKTNCTKFTDTPAKYGAYRDLKAQFLGQTELLEDLVRDFNVPLICLMPEYVPAMLAADMIRQQPGDNSWQQTEERMRADIESWDPSVRIVWLKDSIRGRLSTTPTQPGGTASPRSAGFDADVEWCLFPDGAFLYLDGGQLDLGILRDTVVSATNKFQTFYESWEAVAPLVSNTLCFWMTSSLCSDGASQIATNIAICSPQDS